MVKVPEPVAAKAVTKSIETEDKKLAKPNPAKSPTTSQLAKYDALIQAGNNAIGTLNFGAAIAAFDEAHKLRPSDKRAADLLAYARSARQNLQQRKHETDSIEMAKLTRITFEQANAATLANDWKNALNLYKKVLELSPTPAQLVFSKRRIEAIDFQLSKN